MWVAWFSGPMLKYPLSLFSIGLTLSLRPAGLLRDDGWDWKNNINLICTMELNLKSGPGLKSVQVMVRLRIFPIFSFLAKVLSFLSRNDNIFARNENIRKICKRTITWTYFSYHSIQGKPINVQNHHKLKSPSFILWKGYKCHKCNSICTKDKK